MKKIILIVALLLMAFVGNAQDVKKFRLRSINEDVYREIVGNWSMGFYLITKIESGLDDNYDKLKYGEREKDNVKLISIENTIQELKKEIEKAKSNNRLKKDLNQICIECYEKEYQYQIDENIKNSQYCDYKQDWLYCSNLQELRSKSDSIASIAKRKFYFISQGSKETIMLYQDAPKDSNFHYELYLWFDLGGNIGGNKDLEIEGKDYYIFSEMTGSLLDIFPFWKKYIDPKANVEDIANNINNTNSKIIQVKDKRIRYTLQKQDDKQWHIFGR